MNKYCKSGISLCEEDEPNTKLFKLIIIKYTISFHILVHTDLLI